jgi:hypothetical protein
MLDVEFVKMSTSAGKHCVSDPIQHYTTCDISQKHMYGPTLLTLHSQSLRIELPRFIVENKLGMLALRLTLKRYPVVSVHLTRPAARRAPYIESIRTITHVSQTLTADRPNSKCWALRCELEIDRKYTNPPYPKHRIHFPERDLSHSQHQRAV